MRRYAFYDQNIGVVLGDGEALVIDTRSTYGQAREILADLRSLTSDPVTVVVDTHGHFDHAFGNAIFRPATIWGHEGCVPFMERTGEARKAKIAAETPELAGELDEVVIDPPDRTFESSATRRGRRARGRAALPGSGPHRPRHRRSPCRARTCVFAGDLLENGAVPFYGDAYPHRLGRDGRAARLGSWMPDRGVVVPGHGDHAGRAFADAQAASIAAVAALAARVHAGELTLDDAIAAHPFPEHPPEDAREPLARAVAQLRAELARA